MRIIWKVVRILQELTMTYSLKNSVSYCEVNDRTVFLDTISDRYFMVSQSMENAFDEFKRGNSLDDCGSEALFRAGILELSEQESADRRSPRAVRYNLPKTDKHKPNAYRIIAAAYSLLSEKRRLKRHGVHYVIQELRARSSSLPDMRCDDRDAIELITAFDATGLLISPAEQCLVRSTALVRSLASIGRGARLVLGVRLDPFGAHAWAQIDDIVLNDSVEEVGKFTPILVA